MKELEIKPNYTELGRKYNCDPRTVKKYNNGYEGKFNELVNDNKLNISTIEDLLLGNYKLHQKNMNQYTVELLSKKINEKQFINKKNKTGTRTDIN